MESIGDCVEILCKLVDKKLARKSFVDSYRAKFAFNGKIVHSQPITISIPYQF